MMMFERHFLLLQLLVALERLHLQNKASSRELGIFLNGFDKQGIEEAALLEHKPDWMEPQVHTVRLTLINCLFGVNRPKFFKVDR
ncbi:hypothetical protein DPMN_059081 [Dreissena polymorpha]|uniref:Secreted protein n=1 Tax=Dreissena polymorpha TaxID=45954 RepID=A0A9D4HEJ2_DREPO|nr:hypothetical protein DPMN_059081 [Dreissena polymorpha]